MATALYPLRFKPVYKDYIWGGTRLAERFGRTVGSPTCAESWELACLADGMSVVENGPLAGRTLVELLTEFGPALVGKQSGSHFPLLIKILDACERLSVQVHPNEQTAITSGGEPKTEAWYILDAKPGAGVYLGFREHVTPADLETAVLNGSVGDLLNWLPVEQGQMIFVPGGRVHAIGAGCLMLEVQQTSNTTFRVYDWGRVGADGKSRPLHVVEAGHAIQWKDEVPMVCKPMTVTRSDEAHEEDLLQCNFFQIKRLTFRGSYRIANAGAAFQALFVARGQIHVKEMGETISAGSTFMLPASVESCSLRAVAGPAEAIQIRPGATG